MSRTAPPKTARNRRPSGLRLPTGELPAPEEVPRTRGTLAGRLGRERRDTRRFGSSIFGALLLAVGGFLPVAAQVPSTLALSDTLSYRGGTFTVPLTVTSAEAVVGFSGGIAHDPAVVTLDAVSPGSALPPGAGVFFVNQAPAGGTGVTFGVVLDEDLVPPFTTLPAGQVHELAVLHYTVLATAPPGTSPLVWTDLLGDPPVETVVAIEDATGSPSEDTLVTVDGLVTVTLSTFLRGDATDDGSVNLIDVLRTLELIFLPLGGVECFDVLDANDNGVLGVSDALYLLGYLFLGTVPPPAVPFEECGVDPTADDLPCDGLRDACP